MISRTLAGTLTLLVAIGGGTGPRAAAQAPDPSAAAQNPSSDARDPIDPATFELWSSGRYRLGASDVIELIFPYVSEFNQVLTVQPDGYVTLRAAGELRVQGRSLPELRQLLTEAYTPILRDPVITVMLKEFEKPYFIAAGQVKQPGKFDLRGPLTVTQALAISGGLTDAAKHSQVVLFRRYSAEMIEVKQIDIKHMLTTRDLSEDLLLRPGDTIFVPKNLTSQLKPLITVASMALYLSRTSW